MQAFLDGVLGGIAALFPVVDPIGGVPIFLVLTAGVPNALRHRYAWAITRNVVVLLIGALLVGAVFSAFWGFPGGGAHCRRHRGLPCGLESHEL